MVRIGEPKADRGCPLRLADMAHTWTLSGASDLSSLRLAG